MKKETGPCLEKSRKAYSTHTHTHKNQHNNHKHMIYIVHCHTCKKHTQHLRQERDLDNIKKDRRICSSRWLIKENTENALSRHQNENLGSLTRRTGQRSHLQPKEKGPYIDLGRFWISGVSQIFFRHSNVLTALGMEYHQAFKCTHLIHSDPVWKSYCLYLNVSLYAQQRDLTSDMECHKRTCKDFTPSERQAHNYIPPCQPYTTVGESPNLVVHKGLGGKAQHSSTGWLGHVSAALQPDARQGHRVEGTNFWCPLKKLPCFLCLLTLLQLL